MGAVCIAAAAFYWPATGAALNCRKIFFRPPAPVICFTSVRAFAPASTSTVLFWQRWPSARLQAVDQSGKRTQNIPYPFQGFLSNHKRHPLLFFFAGIDWRFYSPGFFLHQKSGREKGTGKCTVACRSSFA